MIAQLPAGWLLNRFDSIRIYGVSYVPCSRCTLAQVLLSMLPASAAITGLLA